MSFLRNTLEQLLEHHSLSESEASQLLLALTDEAIAPAMAGALLAALRSKGVTPDEVQCSSGVHANIQHQLDTVDAVSDTACKVVNGLIKLTDDILLQVQHLLKSRI